MHNKDTIDADTLREVFDVLAESGNSSELCTLYEHAKEAKRSYPHLKSTTKKILEKNYGITTTS